MIYYSVFFIIFLFSMIEIENKNLAKIFYIPFIFFLLFFIGFRYEVGGDWGNYLDMYNSFKELSLNYESILKSDIGYSLLNIFSAYLGFEDTIFINFISALLVCIFLSLTFSKLKMPWVAMLLYYPFHVLIVSLGYTRQSIAAAIMLYAFTFLLSSDRRKFLLYSILAVLFHKSAMFCLIFIPLSFIGEKRYHLFLYNAFSLFTIFSIVYYVYHFSEWLYSSSGELQSNGTIVRFSSHFIPIILYFGYRNIFTKEHSKIMDYFLVLIVVLFICSFFASTLSDRLNIYLVFFDLFVVIQIFYNSKFTDKFLLLILFFIFFYVYIYVWLSYGEWSIKAWLPYNNYIMSYF